MAIIPVPSLEQFQTHLYTSACTLLKNTDSNATDKDFIQLIQEISKSSQLSDLIALTDNVKQKLQNHPDDPSVITDMIKVALCRLIFSTRLLDAGQREPAWSHLAHANGLLAHAEICMRIPTFANSVTSFSRRKTASTAGKKNSSIWDRIKQQTWSLANEQEPQGGWQSRMAAAKSLSPQVSVYAKENGKAISPDSLVERVDEYLKDMPESSTFFSKRKKNSRISID